MTHDISEHVRSYLNARFLVHTKRTCKTAVANVSEAEIIAALLYDKEWGFKWLLRHAVRNNNTQLLQFLYGHAENCSEEHASEHGIMKWPWHELQLMDKATDIGNILWPTGAASIDVMKWLMCVSVSRPRLPQAEVISIDGATSSSDHDRESL